MKYKDIDQQLTYLMDITDKEKRVEQMHHFFMKMKTKDLHKFIEQERLSVNCALACYYSMLASENYKQETLS